jgi:hypothetical protein
MTTLAGITVAVNETMAFGPPPAGTIGPATTDTAIVGAALTARTVDAVAIPPALSVAVIETV